ncbi:DNA-binding response OmpR family regulator [Hydrogenoanaerobacterium saccharovorans]|uniref:Stage 0 sporulation protein A homolog n=1 Tax=Hydrogenoanaerobacterium saccharovorans TaxID=474960 RepID=A0A1H8E0Q5_9FIRM|nr:response regulator transcription factor [Hydrogenoanaerobacterium saccharovorans]RPF42077.1 DNA-binding response OmpR family regulator [Hydrogenoanaerobacterium saccharovorans]SEN13062.1 DNA-binding response regulator, OmpR family, contains REC and winged-helix (wHTH) domain [Hydrogenoanaerobacterium saccharovorans]
MDYTILVAEDDKDILSLVKLYLESSGYRVLAAQDGEQAWELVQAEKIDLAVLDVMMPKMDGFALTQKIRETYNMPILLLTAKIEDTDKILGLNLGADDYMTKPFNPLEVVARVGANLRRFYKLNSTQCVEKEPVLLTLGELELDTEKLILRKNGTEIVITPNEYKLLAFMMKSPGRVYTKSQLCEAVNGEYYDNYENAIMVHISHLRDKIEDDPRNSCYIKNVRGLGYKIEEIK